MNRANLSCGGSVRGRPVQDRRKQGCLREAPMDGFTAFLDRPPPRRASANHPRHLFMNNARGNNARDGLTDWL
jgi:hypothetical protein